MGADPGGRTKARYLGKVDKVCLDTWIYGHTDVITSDGIFHFLSMSKYEVTRF